MISAAIKSDKYFSMLNYVFFIFLMATSLAAHAAGEVAKLSISSGAQKCVEVAGEEERSCDQYSFDKMDINLELEQWNQSDTGRIWVGSYRDTIEIADLSIERKVIVFRVHSNENQINSPVMNLFIATQSLGDEERVPVLFAAAKNSDELQYVSLMNNPVTVSGKSIHLRIDLFGVNTFPMSNLIPGQSSIYDHFNGNFFNFPGEKKLKDFNYFSSSKTR
jgi:hypothetical protein